MKVTVEAVKRDGKAFKGNDGIWYSTRGDACAKLNKGDVVEFQCQVNGKWNNVVDDKLTVSQSAPVSGPGKRWHAYEDKAYQNKINQRIGRQNALTNAVVGYGPMNDEETEDQYVEGVLTMAESFARWTSGQDIDSVMDARRPPEPEPPAQEEPPVPDQENAPTLDPNDDVTF